MKLFLPKSCTIDRVRPILRHVSSDATILWLAQNVVRTANLAMLDFAHLLPAIIHQPMSAHPDQPETNKYSCIPLADERQLLARAQAGETPAFGELVKRYQTSVFNVCYRMMGNRQEAEDMAQEAFIRAYERLHTFDAARAFGPWMRTVAANLCRNRLQRNIPHATPLADIADRLPQDVDSPHPAHGNPERSAVQQENADQLRAVIGTLSPNQRAVIELRHFQELSYEEIAATLQLSLSAVKTNLFRARKVLAAKLQSEKLHTHEQQSR